MIATIHEDDDSKTLRQKLIQLMEDMDVKMRMLNDNVYDFTRNRAVPGISSVSVETDEE